MRNPYKVFSKLDIIELLEYNEPLYILDAELSRRTIKYSVNNYIIIQWKTQGEHYRLSTVHVQGINIIELNYFKLSADDLIDWLYFHRKYYNKSINIIEGVK